MLISKFDTTNIEVYLEDFENKYNFVFPEQYKKFLIKYNGGQTPESEFKINRLASDIRGFFGLGEADEYYNYSFLENSGRINNFLEDNVMPIGKTIYGDYIVIGIGEENQGRIFFYYHDRPKKYIELVEDFISFIKKCKSKKIGHIRTIEERKEALIKNGKEKNITPDWIEAWQEEIDEYANIHQEELVLE